jgi:signal transduction histidine kinase
MSDVRPPAPRLLRPSLRTNAVLTVLAMLVLPQAIVVAWSAMERDIGGKLQWSALAAAKETSDVLAEGDADAEKIETVADKYGARVRVVRRDGTTRFDVDRDQGTDLVHQIGTLFFGPDGAPTLRELDATLEPVPSRPEVLRVTGWDAPRIPEHPPPPEGSAHPYPFGTAQRYQPGSPAPVSALYAGSKPPPRDAHEETGCRTSPGAKLLVCHAARAAGGADPGEVVYVQESSRRAVRALYDLRYQLLRLSLVMLPLALAFSWWMGRRMVKPIEWLRERVLEKAKTGSPRADLGSPEVDEVADLAKAFNDLLGSLDDKRRENEAFVADLVHEFKNPVAAIRATAESLGGGPVDEKRAQRLARILADSSARLDALVSQFLELARAEAGMPNEARTRVDMAALARGVVSSIEPRWTGVRFAVEADGAIDVEGVEARLDSLVRNLVDNAASFAGEGGDVSLSVAKSERGVVIEVRDSGPGIAEADLPRVFERFFTTRAVAAEAHPNARKEKGTGLGLALVKAIAEAHGGDVSARSSPGEGATFRVVLPSAGGG